MASFHSLLTAVQPTPYQLYLFIDEYDNFANEVMMAYGNEDQERYDALVSGEGLLKTVFKNIKVETQADGLVFSTPVSREQYQVAVNCIYHDAEHPSHILLPIIERA